MLLKTSLRNQFYKHTKTCSKLIAFYILTSVGRTWGPDKANSRECIKNVPCGWHFLFRPLLWKHIKPFWASWCYAEDILIAIERCRYIKVGKETQSIWKPHGVLKNVLHFSSQESESGAFEAEQSRADGLPAMSFFLIIHGTGRIT